MNLDQAKRMAADAHVHGHLQFLLSAAKGELSRADYESLLEYCDKFKE